jgi:hypothetical protein
MNGEPVALEGGDQGVILRRYGDDGSQGVAESKGDENPDLCLYLNSRIR